MLTMHNRKRQGDVHYLDLKSYAEQINREMNHETTDFTKALSDSEKLMTQR